MKILKSRDRIEDSIMSVCLMWASSRSKDPSTKVGACIYDKRSGGLFMGYNGFPAGVPDEEEIWKARSADPNKALMLTKYDLVIHAEVNAVRKALVAGVDMASATLFTTHIPCTDCMKNVVLANDIKLVIYQHVGYQSRTSRDNFVVTELARLGGVQVEQLPEYFAARNAALDARLAQRDAQPLPMPSPEPANAPSDRPEPSKLVWRGSGTCPKCRYTRKWLLEPGLITMIANGASSAALAAYETSRGFCGQCKLSIRLSRAIPPGDEGEESC